MKFKDEEERDLQQKISSILGSTAHGRVSGGFGARAANLPQQAGPISSKIRIVAVSDLHGHLPEIPETDLLLLAGDLCPVSNHRLAYQEAWLDYEFRSWLKEVPATFIVAVAGNHDMIFQEKPHRVPKLPWRYLEDSGVRVCGLNVWGSPWQLRFHDWAFNLEEPGLAKKWALIPDDTDILVLHGPPYGYGDAVPRRLTDANETEWPEAEHVGSPSLLKRIKRIKPRLVVYGHIHSGRGVYQFGDTTLANVTLVNEAYSPVHQPFVTEIETTIAGVS